MVGRKPVFSKVAKGNYTKEQLSVKRDAEEEMGKLDPLQHTPPNGMKGDARAEWTHMYKYIKELPISAIDRSIMTAYCEAYGTYMAMTREIRQTGYFVIGSQGERKPNPSVRMRRDAEEDMRKNLSVMGLTAVSRLKMYMEEEKKAEKEAFNFDVL